MNDPGSERDKSGGPVGDATVLLLRISKGDLDAANELLPLVYADLRARAGSYARRHDMNHTLQPTAVVHEAYIKLINSPNRDWKSRAHFVAVAATAMRQILIDHARRRAAFQRARDSRARTASITASAHSSPVDLLALDEALGKLTRVNPRWARVVELRFFGGLTNGEVASVLEFSKSTIENEWRAARAWLLSQLEEERTP